MERMYRVFAKGIRYCLLLTAAGVNLFGQDITINGSATGRTFDGVSGCSGGGATSVLLLSYAEPYRSQILDLLFKPKFGASMTTHFFEIGGDGNSTQSTTPSHMHTKDDENYQRGWEWWLIKEAKKRNPDITLDGTAWTCPGWVGNGDFWSQDMCDYYANWIKGLKSTYGYDLDALGCRNEGGTDLNFAKILRTTLDNNSLSNVKIHAFDNWNPSKWDFCSQFAGDQALNNAIDIIGVHIAWDSQWSETNNPPTAAATNSGKLIWDTEEHIYNNGPYRGFDGALSMISAINSNYINMKITKTVFWYLIGAIYPFEGWYDVSLGNASEPWSGHYTLDPKIWAYAHYNQFVDLGWQFLDGACRAIGSSINDGSVCVLKSPDNQDFSIIIETKGCSSNKTLNFTISGGLPTDKPLCVWKSTASAQFVKQTDITPANGSFSVTVEPKAIVSISTTTGQQKGSYTIPASESFPFPYYETYDHYTEPELWGYMPYYNIDRGGVFEIADRPDGTGAGKCLRQVMTRWATGWWNHWTPLSVLGDMNWADYEVSVDIYFDGGGWAGIMGRCNGGDGKDLRLWPDGGWELYAGGTRLDNGSVTLSGQWHNVKLRFQGNTITAFIENQQVCQVNNSNFSRGMVALMAGSSPNTAMFDNLLVNMVGGATPQPTVFAQDETPPYALPTPVGVVKKPSLGISATSEVTSFKVMGSHFIVPKTPADKRVECSLYDLSGRLLLKTIARGSEMLSIQGEGHLAESVFIVKVKAIE